MSYYLGLDIGTNSVGWAVTDENFKVVKKSGKSLWGARLFEPAKDQKTRRQNRANRRRLMRRKQRLSLLCDIFTPEMNKVDPLFFIRMRDSAFHLEDKDPSLTGKYSLFADRTMTDKEFYKKYPTIYHLRKHLIESDEKADIREIYLAFHHMIKYRGNFLQAEKEISNQGADEQTIEEAFSHLNDAILNFNERCENEEDYLSSFEVEGRGKDIYDLFKSSKTKGKLQDELKKLFGLKKIPPLLKVITGSKVKPSVFYPDQKEQFTEIDKDHEIELSSEKFDTTTLPVIRDFYPDELADLVLAGKEIYDTIAVIKLMDGCRSISYAMEKKYNSHKEQLEVFKKYIKENFGSKKYNEWFRLLPQKDKANYVSYIGSTIQNGKKTTCSHSSRDAFYKEVKALLKERTDNTAKKILDEIENNTFLPRINSTDNGVIPYQLNENEMKLIIQKQKKYYPFFDEKDKEGYSNADKIISLLTFRIPYYVGPLNLNVPKDKESRGWCVRKSEGKIYPWNFDRMIDKDKSAEEFITRMRSTCTYLYGETTIPKKSLLYSEFEMLQEINKIKINGEPLRQNIKEMIIQNLFMKEKKVTIKRIKEYLLSVLEKWSR